jgi:hypothetical protein
MIPLLLLIQLAAPLFTLALPSSHKDDSTLYMFLKRVSIFMILYLALGHSSAYQAAL